MKVHSDYKTFDIATNALEMIPRFQAELEKLRGGRIEVTELFIPRVFPRGEKSFAIQYRLVVVNNEKNETETLTYFGHLLGKSGRWPDYIEEHSDSVLVWNDLRLVVPIFPFDPKLTSLRDFVDLKGAKRLLQKHAAALGLSERRWSVVDCQLLGYRLERRAVLRYVLEVAQSADRDAHTQTIIARIVRQNKIKSAIESLLFLKTNGFNMDSIDRLTIPDFPCSDGDNGVYFMEAVPGELLNSLTASQKIAAGCAGAGLLLRKLHGLRTVMLPPFTRDQEMIDLEAKTSLASGIFPEISAQFVELFSSLRMEGEKLPSPSQAVVIHRDFYDKQILYSPDRLTLLDFDNLSLGDPAQDYGNFLAHLALRQLQEPTNADNIAAGNTEFLNGYGIQDENFTRRARWWEASALLRLAAIYSLRPRWRGIIPSLLQEAAKIIANNSTKKRGVLCD